MSIQTYRRLPFTITRTARTTGNDEAAPRGYLADRLPIKIDYWKNGDVSLEADDNVPLFTHVKATGKVIRGASEGEDRVARTDFLWSDQAPPSRNAPTAAKLALLYVLWDCAARDEIEVDLASLLPGSDCNEDDVLQSDLRAIRPEMRLVDEHRDRQTRRIRELETPVSPPIRTPQPQSETAIAAALAAAQSAAAKPATSPSTPIVGTLKI